MERLGGEGQQKKKSGDLLVGILDVPDVPDVLDVPTVETVGRACQRPYAWDAAFGALPELHSVQLGYV